MSAPSHTVSPAVGARLAELFVTAAAELAAVARTEIAPIGIPVRDGRVSLGRLRDQMTQHDELELVTGFATACWIGPPGGRPPVLGRLTYRTRTTIDHRGRLRLDHRTRTWLAVADPNRFDVVTLPAEAGEILVMPVEDFTRRWEAISR